MSETVNWEKTLIGSVLAYPETMQACEDLHTSDFTGSNQLIWAELLIMHRNQAIDQVALRERLRTNDLLDSLGADIDNGAITGEDYLLEVWSRRGQQVETYRDEVVDAAIKRALRKVGALIAADAQSNMPAEEALDEAEQRILSVRRNRAVGGVTLGQILSAYTGRVTDIREHGITPGWTPNLEAIKNLVRYVDRTEYITIAARPGQGKSSLLRHEALQTVLRQNKPVIIFNLENDESEYAKFAIAAVAGIDSDRLKQATVLTEQEMQDVREAADLLSRAPLHIITLGAPSVAEVTRIARKYVSEVSPAWIGLDYVQLMDNGIENKVQDVSRSSQLLRAFALNNQVPILSAAQLSRAVETRGAANGMNPRPILSDLRESGALEQDSTQVRFPWVPWKDPTPQQLSIFPENEGEIVRALPMRVIVAKNRNGAVGDTDVIKWCKHTSTFYTMQRGAIAI